MSCGAGVEKLTLVFHPHLLSNGVVYDSQLCVEAWALVSNAEMIKTVTICNADITLVPTLFIPMHHKIMCLYIHVYYIIYIYVHVLYIHVHVLAPWLAKEQ